jgi:hypothetical protein
VRHGPPVTQSSLAQLSDVCGHRPARVFLGLFRVENFGKLIVQVGDDPTQAAG